MARIVEINAACNYGSTGRIMEAIGRLAEQAGHEVLCVHGGRYVLPSKLQTLLSQPCWMDYVHYVLGYIFGRQGRFSTYYTKQLVKRLKEYKPDLIHLHNLHGYYLDYEVLGRYLRQANVPVVWTLHDCWPLTGHCAYYATETGVCEQWTSACRHCSKKKDYPRILLDRVSEEHQLKKELFGGIDKLTMVPVSQWMGENVRRSYLKDKPMAVIRNGIDLNVFAERGPRAELRHKWGIGEDEYMLLGVASHWTNRKGYADILSLSDLEGVRLVLVGLTHRQKKHLPQGITGIESIESADALAELYSIADLFVNPTYSDTFPTTNLEAQACGTPVLTYNTDGSPETITGQTGVVVEKGNKQALREAVEYLRQNPLNREQCRRWGRQQYDQKERFQDYIALYQQVLNQHEN